ncbi:MAG: DUF2953 domain-containing protein [Lutisporaceae bacterium]
MWILFIILKIILYLFLAILLLFITLLVVPFNYQGEVAVMEGISYSYRFGWFWNLFSIRGSRSGEIYTTDIYIRNKRIYKVNITEKEENPKKAANVEIRKKKREKKEHKTENNLESMFDIKFIKEALEYLKKVIKQVKPKHLHLKGVYGFEDPSLTGMIAGFIYTLQGIVPQSKLQLQPCFTDEVFELEAEMAGEVLLGKIAYDTVRFFLKPDIRKKIFKKSKKVKPKTKQ